MPTAIERDMETRMPRRRGRNTNRGTADVLRATTVAAVVSGAPSTVHALVTGRSPFDAVRAAATLLPSRGPRSEVGELATGVAVHGAISLGWGLMLAAVLPRRHAALWGAAAGCAIAALDLGVIGRRVPAIAELPTGPQVADHVAFGAVVGFVLSRSRGPG
jgi:hypothetical protein